jgi:hypothetical protein
VHEVKSAGKLLLSFDKEISNPDALVKQLLEPDEEDDWDELDGPRPYSDHKSLEYAHVGHSVDLTLPGEFRLGHEDIQEWQLQPLVSFIIQKKADTLSFMTALGSLRSSYLEGAYKELGLPEPGRWLKEMPRRFQDIMWDTVKKKYAAREPDDECSRFMGWFTKRVLKRWEATAVDYDAIFTFHVPGEREREYLKLFYEIREGEKVDGRDERLTKGRLPELLRELVKDGFIDEKEIDPPLKDYYPTEEDVHNHAHGRGNSKVKSRLEKKVALTFSRKKATINISPNVKLLAAGDDDKDQAIVAADDLSALEAVVDTDRVYSVLYCGKHSGFLMSHEKFPAGSQATGLIYRLTLVADGAEPEGPVVNIKGNRFLVKKMDQIDESDRVRDQLFDSNSDVVGAKSVTVITDVPVDEFERKYFKDFMAHAMLHRTPAMGPGDMFAGLEAVDKVEEITDLAFWLGVGLGPRTRFTSFDFNGRFAFKVEMTREWDIAHELPIIAHSLVNYLNEVGVPMHQEIMLGEGGRAQVETKIKERNFQEAHIGEIVSALQGNGLVKFLSYFITQRDKYSLWRFGEAMEPCEVCGLNYVGGNVSSTERKEQWCDGFHAEGLHHLSHHPHTYKNTFGQLEKIYLAMQDAEDHTPVFIEYPDIMPEFNAFAKAYNEHITVEAEGYNFWESTRGGINAEEEEIEDDPMLQRLLQEETEINNRCREQESKMQDAVQALQKKYDTLRGETTPEDTEEWKIRNFWANQLMIFGLYQIESPKQLTEFAGQELMEKPVKLMRG